MFVEQFSPVIHSINDRNLQAIVAGDFNIDLLKIQEREKYGEFLDLMCTNRLYPKITFPTRFARKSCSLIDQIYCRFHSPNIIVSPVVVKSHISDHCPCIISINIFQSKTHKPKYVTIRKISPERIENFKAEIANAYLAENIDNRLCTDPNHSYDILYGILADARDHHLPIRRVRFDKHRHKMSKWITSGILKSIHFRDKLYRKCKSLNPETTDYVNAKINLKVYNGILSRNIRLAKQMHYAQEFKKYQNDIRKTWDTLKDILNKMKCKSVYPKMFLLNGSQITNMSSITNKFNEYFTSVGSRLANEIDTSDKLPFNSYLRTPSINTFQFTFCTCDNIMKYINNLKPKCSAGHDGISSKLLKDIAQIIAPTLTIIINQSLYTGIFPEKLKIAKVTPLFKHGEKNLMENYRPISLLASISKIFERVVFNQIYQYFVENNLLFDGQYGFRKHHSTELAALELVDRISNGLDKKETPVSIFLDLSKAFDTLDHKLLLIKLQYYGIKDVALQWFSSYLSDRFQLVEMDGFRSDMLNITTGVPQGSILGPLLFIIYVNDMHSISDKFNFIAYADDTTLTSPLLTFTRGVNCHIDTISSEMNKEIKKITDWLAVNKLSLNASKTKFMVFHYYQKVIADKDVPQLKIGNIDIERVKEFNFLGLSINENLTWSSHAKKISNKISKIIGIMNRLKRFLPLSALKLMYFSLINSHLQFCVATWGFDHSRISKLQKKAIRVMCNARYNAHTDPLFKENKILKIRDIFNLNCLKLYHKYKNQDLPNFFNNMFTTNADIHSYHTRRRNDLHYFSYNTEGASKRTRHAIPNIINELTPLVREKLSTLNLEQFTNYYKSFIIDSYEVTCRIHQCYICNRR